MQMLVICMAVIYLLAFLLAIFDRILNSKDTNFPKVFNLPLLYS